MGLGVFWIGFFSKPVACAALATIPSTNLHIYSVWIRIRANLFSLAFHPKTKIMALFIMK